MVIMDTDTEDTEDTEDIMVTLTVTMARGLLMLSPPSLLEPAVWCPPPLLSSTTLQSSLMSPTPPTLWPMLDMPPIPWPIMDSPCLLLPLLLLRRPWLPRG